MRDDMRFAGLHVPCWGLMQELQPQRAVTHMRFTCVDRVLAAVTWRLLTIFMFSAPMHSPRGMWFTSAHSTPPAASLISLLQHVAATSAMVYQQCRQKSAFCVWWAMHRNAQGACVPWECSVHVGFLCDTFTRLQAATRPLQGCVCIACKLCCLLLFA
jgi:hypothetical protein